MRIFNSVPDVTRIWRRRWTKSLIALVITYISITIGLIGVAFYFSPSRFSGEVETIPATRDSTEVIEVVQAYLKTATHRGFHDLDEQASSCWDVFKDEPFVAEYLNRGEWQIHAWYDRLRYFWRVDDLTLEVRRDLWLQDFLERPQPAISC